MNAFEELVAGLLRREGYWTHQSYKVVLSKQDKVSIGKPSLPRIEIDILGYKASSNTLLWVECKSYLDSSGVSLSNFDAENGRYKVFANKELRSVATKQLISQATKSGLALGHPKVEYWLVAGHIARESRLGLQKRFDSEGWKLRTDEWIVSQLKAMADDRGEAIPHGVDRGVPYSATSGMHRMLSQEIPPEPERVAPESAICRSTRHR
jgi:hypothetical protein